MRSYSLLHSIRERNRKMSLRSRSAVPLPLRYMKGTWKTRQQPEKGHSRPNAENLSGSDMMDQDNDEGHEINSMFDARFDDKM